MAEERLGANFSIDITQLEAGLKTANRLIRESTSEFRRASAGLNDWSHSEDGLNAKIRSLSSIIDIQKEKVRALSAQYDKLIDEGLDPASDRAINLRTQLKNEQAALARNELELKNNKQALKELGNESDSSGKKLEKLGEVGKAAGKAIATALAAAGAAVIGLTKSAIENYAEYEQLVGGVETLFDTSSKKVVEYANNAYKTAGLSANDYMETVTSFSASLLQGLDGDTAKAAEIADKAITDMSDNANKMGTSMESIQNAYQGFAKQNYTMLDNLKLGYGGTQAEMARLINDSKVLGDVIVDEKTVKDVSFDKLIEAIHVVQTEMGITGTTAKEASTTIQGSLSAMSSAWTNLLTGMADESQDIDQLILNLVDSVATFAENLLPRISVVMDGIIKMVEKLLPQIPPLLEQFMPVLIDGIMTLTNGVVEILPQVVDTIMQVIPQLITALISMLPTLLQTVVTIIVQIITAISTMLPTIVDAVMQVLPILINSLIAAIPQLLQAAITLLLAIVDAIPVIITALVDALPSIVSTIVSTLIANLPMVLAGAIRLLGALIEAIPIITVELVRSMPQIITGIVDGLIQGIPDMIQAGKDMLSGLFEGLINLDVIWASVKRLGNSILDGIKGFFGINSPSKLMETMIGKNLALGIGEGFDENMADVNRKINNAIELEDININRNGGIGGKRQVVVNQYNTYSQAHSRYELYKSKQQTAAAVRLAIGTV